MRTEKEKMLAGEAYDCADAELQARWHKAKRLQQAYNVTLSDDKEQISGLLDELIGSRGEDAWISAPFFVDYGENIHIGRNVEINMNCVFLDCNTITIGDYSGIGPGVHIYTVFHSTDPQERLPERSTFWKSLTAPVSIGRNVWIGGGSIILPGVTIGDEATIGAGSVVTKDIPARCIAVGNPCRVIKRI
ncbi:MAG: sugar O-acetyltransferase [Parabacteroides sp.]|nr:sugar O-acetyltransferase [Parabacteroides sp.]